MLSPADLDLVERDPGLPGLATLLDPAAFVRELADVLPELRDARAQIEYLRYKPGANCLARFRLDIDDEMIRGYAKTYGDDASTKFTKACRRPTVTTPAGPGRVLLVDSATEVIMFPNDGKLKTLPRVTDEAGRRRLLKRLVPDVPQLWDASLHHLSYKPERRFVARLDVDGEPTATLKLYTEREYAWTFPKARVLRSGQWLRMPREIGAGREEHIVLLNWLPGTPLRQLTTDSSTARSSVRSVGAALAELHNQDGKGLGTQSPGDIQHAIRAASSSVRCTCPELEDLIADVSRRLRHLLLTDQPGTSAIHGDFYADQVLLDGDRVSIIDLDNAARGNPASDLGLFIAHHEHDAITGRGPGIPVSNVRDALLDGYQTVRPVPSDFQVDLHTASGLVQLAPHHFRHREPDWDERTRTTLLRARDLLDGLQVRQGARQLSAQSAGAPR